MAAKAELKPFSAWSLNTPPDLVLLAIGTDAGGPSRMPSYTGLVGLRPSNGRIPRRHGFLPMALDRPSACRHSQALGTLTTVGATRAALQYGDR